MKFINYNSENAQDGTPKDGVPETDYKMECDRLWKENHTQDTIIKALVFYIEQKEINEPKE